MVNTNWKVGDPISSPFTEHESFDPKSLSVQDNYKLIIGSIVPRPIAWVSSMSAEGKVNLAPFSFFNGLSSNPPAVVISVALSKKSGGAKDTLRNIQETKEFVVNSANEWTAGALVATASEYTHEEDEFKEVGLTPIASLKVKPPRVKESAFQFECKLYEEVKIGDGSPGSTCLFVGEIVQYHYAKGLLTDFKVDIEKLAPIARLGGFEYTTLGERLSLPVPPLNKKIS